MNRKMKGLKEESLQFSHVPSKKIKSFVIQPCFPFPQPFPFPSNLGKKNETMRERTEVGELALLQYSPCEEIQSFTLSQDYPPFVSFL